MRRSIVATFFQADRQIETIAAAGRTDDGVRRMSAPRRWFGVNAPGGDGSVKFTIS